MSDVPYSVWYLSKVVTLIPLQSLCVLLPLKSYCGGEYIRWLTLGVQLHVSDLGEVVVNIFGD
jgi:hypothetical protein